MDARGEVMKPEWKKDAEGNYQNKLHSEAVMRSRERNKDKYNDYMREYTREYNRARRAGLSDEEKEKLREYNRIKKQESRARKKALEPPKPPKTPKPTHANKYPDPSVGFAEAVADTAVREGVVILHGQVVDFNSAWASADADLRERIMTRLPSATDQELMDAYCLLHEERYGEPFDF